MILGVPQEPFGLSNDIRPKLSSPKWEDIKFPVKAPRTDISIKMAPYGDKPKRKKSAALPAQDS